MKILITGATGHIGVNLLRHLSKIVDKKIVCLVLENDDISKIVDFNVDIVYGDIRNEQLMNELICQGDIVIHLAGIIEIGKGKEQVVNSVNYEGAKIVSNACFENKATLTYISSVHVLEPIKNGKIDENCPLNIVSKRGIYEETKARATKHIYDLIDKGLDARIVFPTAVIGPFDYKIGEISQALVMLYKGQIPFYIKGGYSFVDVRDVVKVIVELSLHGRKGDKCIASNRYISIKELVSLSDKVNGKKHFRMYVPTPLIYLAIPFLSLIAKIGKRKPIFTKTMLDTVLSNGVFDNSKMIECLKIEPIDLETSIKDTIDFVNNSSSNFN